MLKTSKILLSIILSISIFATISCDSGTVEVPKTDTTNGTDSTGNTETNNSGDKTDIKSLDGTLIAEVFKDGKIVFGGKTLTKKAKNAEKVIISIDNIAVAEVKAKDSDGFKVRDTNSKLLWKVKISGDKIKISDNEENENAYEIKKKDDGAKVEQNETLIGKVKFNPVSRKVKVKDANEEEVFESRTDSQSLAYGVLLLDKIPEDLRFIIMSELFSRNL